MKWIFKGICVALVATAFIFGLGWVTMHLWNWIVPGLTGWGKLDYWHAIGLLVLCKILFGSFRKGGGCWGGRCGHGGRWGHYKHGAWKKRWEEKMAKMTPEERERVKAEMSRCGWGRNWNEECEPKAEGDNQ
ncbi:MAG TPA: hypothetical protein VL651_16665 [Bacteroidia bacterium]|jgi:hypothetical protein|nr:hypothetical protein [Bacteroidia bacterium]